MPIKVKQKVMIFRNILSDQRKPINDLNYFFGKPTYGFSHLLILKLVSGNSVLNIHTIQKKLNILLMNPGTVSRTALKYSFCSTIAVELNLVEIY